jgi:hypothetical protein
MLPLTQLKQLTELNYLPKITPRDVAVDNVVTLTDEVSKHRVALKVCIDHHSITGFSVWVVHPDIS